MCRHIISHSYNWPKWCFVRMLDTRASMMRLGQIRLCFTVPLHRNNTTLQTDTLTLMCFAQLQMDRCKLQKFFCATYAQKLIGTRGNSTLFHGVSKPLGHLLSVVTISHLLHIYFCTVKNQSLSASLPYPGRVTKMQWRGVAELTPHFTVGPYFIYTRCI